MTSSDQFDGKFRSLKYPKQTESFFISSRTAGVKLHEGVGVERGSLQEYRRGSVHILKMAHECLSATVFKY